MKKLQIAGGIFVIVFAISALFYFSKSIDSSQELSQSLYDAIHIKNIRVSGKRMGDGYPMLRQEFDTTFHDRLVELTDWTVVPDLAIDHTLVGEASIQQFEELGVRFSLQFYLYVDGNDLEVTVRLIGLETNPGWWTHKYTGTTSDIRIIAEDLASVISTILESQ